MKFWNGPIFDPESQTATPAAAPAATTTQAAPTPSAPAIPPGHKLVPETEYAEAYSWREKATKGGWKPEDFDEFTQLRETLSKAGRSPKDIMGLFGPKPEPKPEAKAPASVGPDDIEKIIEDRLTKREEAKLKDAYEKDAQAFEKKVSEWVNKTVADDDADIPESHRKVLRDALMFRILETRAAGINDGPLKGQPLASLSDQQLEQIAALVVEYKGSLKGAKLSALAKAAQAKTPPVAKATSTGQQGGSKPPTPGRPATRDEIMETVRNHVAALRK